MSMINLRRYVESFGESHCRVEGFFTGRALKNGVVMREFGVSVPVPNLITNTGLDALRVSCAFDFMQLGTGSTTPAFTDTALTTFGVGIGSPTRSVSNSGSAPYYGQTTLVFTSAVGGATGNWTEIGISSTITTGNLRSHALILDGGGLPTTFPVLADEQFEGTYIFRVYSPASDSLASITLSGTPYDTSTRALNATSSNWASTMQSGITLFIGSASPFGSSRCFTGGLAAVTAASPLGTQLTGDATITNASYSSGSYLQDIAYRWGSASAVGTVNTIKVNMFNASFQVLYNPTFSKLTTQELVHNQRIVWARR